MTIHEVDPVKEKSIKKMSLRIILAMTILIVLYVVYALATKNLNIYLFEIMLSIFVITYNVLNDVVEPKVLGLLDNMTIGQREGYMKIIICDIVGVGALVYWIAGMSSEGSESLMPVIIYFLANQLKRKFRPDFEGTSDDEEEDENIVDSEAVELEEAEILEDTEETEE